MRGIRFTEEEIVRIVRESEGADAATICRQYGVGRTTLWRWRRQYSGVEPDAARRLRQLEEENRRLKQVVGELSVDNRVLKDVLAKKL
jgi:putative transposase